METKTITIPARSLNRISGLIGLLHEAGHAEQSTSQFHTLPRSKKRDRAIIIEQEYMAWQLGWQLAERLNIHDAQLHREYRKAWLKYWSMYLSQLHRADGDALLTSIRESYQ